MDTPIRSKTTEDTINNVDLPLVDPEDSDAEFGELFPTPLLAENYEKWLERTRQDRARYDDNAGQESQLWGTTSLEQAELCATTIPLLHLMNPDYLIKNVTAGQIPSAAFHKGELRSAGYEEALGLAEYVFFSGSRWAGASGVPIYIPSRDLLTLADTVVTLLDIANLSYIPDFPTRLRLYREMAFSGEDFAHMLPYLYIGNYPDKGIFQDSGTFGVIKTWWPPEYITIARRVPTIQHEIKVKGIVPLTRRCRIAALELKSIDTTELSKALHTAGLPEEVLVKEVPSRTIRGFYQAGLEWWAQDKSRNS